MEKTANQGKKGCISRKIEPIFPLQTKYIQENVTFLCLKTKTTSFINATQQVYRYIYNNIVYGVCTSRQRKPLFLIPCVKRQHKKNKCSILKVSMQKSVKIANPYFRWNSERSGLLYKGNILKNRGLKYE